MLTEAATLLRHSQDSAVVQGLQSMGARYSFCQSIAGWLASRL